MCLCGDNLHFAGRVWIDGLVLKWQRILEEKSHHPTIETMSIVVMREEQAVVLEIHQSIDLGQIVSKKRTRTSTRRPFRFLEEREVDLPWV